VALLRLAGRLTGKSGAVQRLTASLEVESSAITAALGWVPPDSLQDGLAATARWWREKEFQP
jgi:nucleoside-diphosphate-sugar epimerase